MLGDASSDFDDRCLQFPATPSGHDDWLMASLLCKKSEKINLGPENKYGDNSVPKHFAFIQVGS